VGSNDLNKPNHSKRITELLWTHSGFLVVAFLILAFPQFCAGQLYHVRIYEEADGLPSPDIKSITQDRWGRIWFATRSGLAAYDGVEWYVPDLTNLVHEIDRGQLTSNSDGDVWAMFSGSRPSLLRLDGDRWIPVPLNPDLTPEYHHFKHMAVASVGGTPVIVLARHPDRLSVLANSRWIELSLAVHGISRINTLATRGELIFVGSPEGLFVISAGTPTAVSRSKAVPAGKEIKSLSVDPTDRALWIVGKDWIGRLVDGRYEPFAEEVAVIQIPEFPEVIAEADGRGGIYVASIAYTLQYIDQRGELETLDPRNGLIDDGTVDIFVDREGILWQGTKRGVLAIISRRFAGYNSQHGLLSDEVSALLKRSDGTMVLGHQNGLTFWDETLETVPFINADQRTRVLDLAEDSRGNLWIAGRRLGLGRRTPDGNMMWRSIDPNGRESVVSVLVDDQDRVWVLSGERLLSLENEILQEVDVAWLSDDIPYMRRLLQGADGSIIITTGGQGIYAIDGSAVRNWRTGLGKDGDSTYDVHEGPDGTVWVGSRMGLFRMQGDSLVRPADSRLKIERPVYFILTDKESRLWIGTDDGVFRFDGERLDHFTVENGLIGRETNRCAGLVDDAGRVWIGTDRGLAIYRDRYDTIEPAPPLVRLIGLEADGTSYPLDRDLDLPSRSGTVVFNFRAVTFAEENRILLRSRLEGFDPDWLEPYNSPEQVIRYTNLPAGRYRFHLQAAGFGQPWSDVVRSPEIVVPGPIWRRPWFIFVALLGALAALSLPIIVIAQRRYAARLKDEVEAQVAENLRIGAEVQKSRKLEALGVLAGGLAHDFNNLLTVILGNLNLLAEEERMQADQIARVRSATKAIDRARGLTNQLMTFSRGGAPVLKAGSLANLVRESGEFVMQGSHMSCEFDLVNDLWAVSMDADQISEVINNLLLNAQQAAAPGGRAWVSGRNLDSAPLDLPPGRYVEIAVRDDGPGIDPQHLPMVFDPYFSTKDRGSGLGLSTSYSIMERHGGRLAVETIPGQGATFRIFVPATDELPVEEPVHPLARNGTLHGTILVMDDEDAVRQLLGAMLKRIGLSVEFAVDGVEAIASYKQRLSEGMPYDVVITDLTVPGSMGGKDCVKGLLAEDPNARVVAISGYSNDPVMANHAAYGFCASLAKPVTINDLRELMQRILSTSPV